MYRIVLLVFIILPFNISAQFELVGDAVQIGPSTFRMTEDELNENGSVWYKLRHDFRTDFSVNGEFYFGDFEDGADGIVFVVQDNCIGSGGLGLGIGYLNFPGRSIGVEFDTYQNVGGQVNDPIDDHIAISRDGNVNHLNNLIGPVQMHPSQTNVEDGTWYSYEISYNASLQVIEIYFAGDLRLSYSVDIVSDILDGDPFAYWGFTSATGGFSAANSLSILDFDSFTIPDYLICNGDPPIEITIPYDDIEYTLTPLDGVTAINNGQSVLIDVETTTEYTLLLPDICLGVVEFQFTVEVSDLAVSISEEVDNCSLVSATAIASGGAEPYTFLWSNGTTDDTIFDFQDQTYTVIVTDNNLCTEEFVIEFTEDIIEFDPVQSNVECFGEANGEIILNTSGGNPPYEYLWSTGDTDDTLNGLLAGDYSVTVADSEGCSDTQVFTILEALMPFDLFCGQLIETFCIDLGSAGIVLFGGVPPYESVWSNGETGGEINNLEAGDYVVTVTDGFNCQATCQVTISLESSDLLLFDIKDVLCDDDTSGSIIITVINGRPPYLYSIDGGLNFQESNSFLNLDEGEYQIVVEDDVGCLATTTVTVSSSQVALISAGTDQVIEEGDTITSDANIEPNSSSNTIEWTPLDGLSCSDCENPIMNPLVTTLYTLTVVDENGCVATDQVLITVNSDFNVFIPNIFTPYSGDDNSAFKLYGDEQLAWIRKMEIYDRWGNLIHISKDQDPESYQGWDGTFAGDPVEIGVYVYLFEIELTNGQLHYFSGDVMVVR